MSLRRRPPTTTTSGRIVGSVEKTPASVYGAREETRPTGAVVTAHGRRVRFDKVDNTGVVTLRYQGPLHHIGIGAGYKGWRIAMLIDGRKIEVVGLDGSPLRRLVLDPPGTINRRADQAHRSVSDVSTHRSLMSRDSTWRPRHNGAPSLPQCEKRAGR